jgi:GT2 family glycosyltransferase
VNAPAVSVVIPAWHSDGVIGGCLDALAAQDFQDFEAIVVNSSPADRTSDVMTSGYPAVTLVESRERLLPHAARNVGAGRARGELIVFTDPDCRARPDWLSRLVEAHREGRDVIVGAMDVASPSRAEDGAHLCKFPALLAGLPAGERWIAPTANAAYARRLWEQAGPFDGDLFCGDAVLSWRAAALGSRPWFAPAARVAHHHGCGAGGLWRERLPRGAEFGRARARFEQWSRPRLALQAVALPAAFILCLVRAGRLARRAGWGARFAASLPLQAVGHAGWCAGESGAWARLALGGRG